jgi:hypothetical protein
LSVIFEKARPSIAGANPRRTISTSGSSGMGRNFARGDDFGKGLSDLEAPS